MSLVNFLLAIAAVLHSSPTVPPPRVFTTKSSFLLLCFVVFLFSPTLCVGYYLTCICPHRAPSFVKLASFFFFLREKELETLGIFVLFLVDWISVKSDDVNPSWAGIVISFSKRSRQRVGCGCRFLKNPNQPFSGECKKKMFTFYLNLFLQYANDLGRSSFFCCPNRIFFFLF